MNRGKKYARAIAWILSVLLLVTVLGNFGFLDMFHVCDCTEGDCQVCLVMSSLRAAFRGLLAAGCVMLPVGLFLGTWRNISTFASFAADWNLVSLKVKLSD